MFTKDNGLFLQEIFWTCATLGMVIKEMYIDTVDLVWKLTVNLVETWGGLKVWVRCEAELHDSFFKIIYGLVDQKVACKEVLMKPEMRNEMEKVLLDAGLERDKKSLKKVNWPKNGIWVCVILFYTLQSSPGTRQTRTRVARYIPINHFLIDDLQQEMTRVEIRWAVRDDWICITCTWIDLGGPGTVLTSLYKTGLSSTLQTKLFTTWGVWREADIFWWRLWQRNPVCM